MLKIAGALSRGSEHPVAKVRALHGTETLLVDELKSQPGHGMQVMIGAVEYRLGHAAFAAELSGSEIPEAVAEHSGT